MPTTRGALQLHLGLLERQQPRRIRVSDIFAVDRDIVRDIATVVHHLADSPVAEYPEGLPRRGRRPHQALPSEVWAHRRNRLPSRKLSPSFSTWATHEFALGHGDPCRPVFSSSFRSAGSPLGFCRARKPAAGVSRPLSRRVAAGTADLGKAGPRPARGLKALLVRKPASLDPAAPDPEAPVFPPGFLDRTRREDRQEPAQAFRAKPKERIFP